MSRPMGVTIIAVLAIIGAIMTALGSLPFFGVSWLSSLLGGTGVLTLATGLGVSIGLAVVIVAIVQLVFGIGALSLRPWAWTLGIILFVLSLAVYVAGMFIFGLTAVNVIGALVAAAILAYLYSDEVREAFGHMPYSGVHTGRPSMSA